MNGYYSITEDDGKALMRIYDGVKHTEVSEEFILPDYLPDVKRIIKMEARPKIDGKYVTLGKLDYEGDVICHILFCDEGNHLKSVTFTVSFADGLEIEGIEDECVASLIPEPESVSCKMLNPRRVSIRMRVDTALTVWCRRSFVPELSGAVCGSEEKSRNVDVMKLVCAGESGLNVSCDLEADGALPQIGEIISSSFDMSFYECKGSEGKVLCRGELVTTIFYSSNEGDSEEYTVLFRRLPVAQVVSAEGVDENYSCMARGYVDGSKISVAENGFGERRIAMLDITYRIYLNCVGKTTVKVTEDIYAIGGDVRIEKRKEMFCKLSKLYQTSFGATLALPREELDMSGAENVFSVTADPEITEVTLAEDGKRLKVKGVSKNSSIVRTAEGLVSHEYELPFSVELDGGGIGKDYIYNYDIVCLGAKGRFDSEKFYTELELQLNLMVLETEEIDVLTKAEFSENEAPAERPAMRFYYPSEGETLWDVGKAFGIPTELIAEKNSIKDGALPSVIYIPYAN